jgi:C4-dicarboxylate transporter DctM subunit
MEGKKGGAERVSTVLVLLGSFLVLLLINVPVAFCMSLACVFAFLWKGTIPVLTLTMKLSSGIDTFPFLAIPLFILAGGLMEHGGISLRLVRFARNLVGHIKGGLGFVVVVSEIFFSGISGSSIADASAIGSLLLPSMVRAGYAPPRAAAIVAAATGMGMMIPPCLNMVVLGAMTNISIAGLFMGGFLPGFLMAMTLMVIIYIQSSRGILPGAEGERASFREIIVSFKDSVVPLMMPVIIFGGIFSGVVRSNALARITSHCAPRNSGSAETISKTKREGNSSPSRRRDGQSPRANELPAVTRPVGSRTRTAQKALAALDVGVVVKDEAN